MNQLQAREKPAGKPRQSDVAKVAGVSPSTVSKVLSGESGISQVVRERVLQAIKEMGYSLPESRQTSANTATGTILLVTYYQYLTRESSYFHSEVIHSVLDECKRVGFEIKTLLLNRDYANNMDDYNTRLHESPVDAVMFIGIDFPELIDPVRKAGMIGLIVNGDDPEFGFDCISPAVRDGSRMVTRHLISLGHRDIVHFTHLYRSIIHRRLDGFHEALEEAGLPFSMEKNVIDIGTSSERHFSAERAADEVYRLITEGSLKATAIFCVSDYTAFGVIQGILRAGKRVPEDYSVASFDSLPLVQLCHPKITSAGVDREALGRLAVSRLVDRLQNPQSPVLRIEVGAALFVGGSTAPPTR